MQLSIAHDEAVKARKLKDKPARMREEFLFVAERFLSIGRAQEAAVCLQNAKEELMAAHLMAKLGPRYVSILKSAIVSNQ